MLNAGNVASSPSDAVDGGPSSWGKCDGKEEGKEDEGKDGSSGRAVTGVRGEGGKEGVRGDGG